MTPELFKLKEKILETFADNSTTRNFLREEIDDYARSYARAYAKAMLEDCVQKEVDSINRPVSGTVGTELSRFYDNGKNDCIKEIKERAEKWIK